MATATATATATAAATASTKAKCGGPIRLRSGQASPLAADDETVRRFGRDDDFLGGSREDQMTILGGPATFFLPGEIRQVQKRNAGAPFDFAQGRLLHCATDDETVRRFGRDDDFWWVKGKRDDEFLLGAILVGGCRNA